MRKRVFEGDSRILFDGEKPYILRIHRLPRKPQKKVGELKACLSCGKRFFLETTRNSKDKRWSKFCSIKCGILKLKHWNDKGGKIVDKWGYIQIRRPSDCVNLKKGKYILEHRYLIEKAIKRALKVTEIVHHINGIKTDNRLDNLRLFKNHSEHLRAKHLGFPMFSFSLN